MIEYLKNWYRGRYIPPSNNKSDSGIVFISAGHYEKYFLAKILSVCINFWLKNWQFIVGTLVAIFIAIFYGK